MTRRHLVLCTALALPLAALGGQAGAMGMPDHMDESCLARDRLSNYLDRAYGEGRIARAELDNGHQVELFASRRGTWTLVELTPDGQGCVHAYGQRMKIDGSGVPEQRSPS